MAVAAKSEGARYEVSIDVVLPAMNEEGAIGWVVERIPAGMNAIVVNNNSTDRTAEVAAAAGALVVNETVPGFGSACWAGLQASTADIVCYLDADGSLDPQDLHLVIAPVVAGTVDLQLGRRMPSKGAMRWHQKAGNAFLARQIRRRSNAPVHDLGPMRAIHRVQLLSLGMTDRRSGWPLEMVLRAQRDGLRIGEVGVPYAPRRAGESKVTGTIKGTMRAIEDMSRLLASPELKAGTKTSAAPDIPGPQASPHR
jgi:glycosyltransferase involved in cell wall biosynthesis